MAPFPTRPERTWSDPRPRLDLFGFQTPYVGIMPWPGPAPLLSPANLTPERWPRPARPLRPTLPASPHAPPSLAKRAERAEPRANGCGSAGAWSRKHALDMALWNRRPTAGLIHHSDHGTQYTSLAFGRRCREAGIAQSMGSVGDCFDNAMAESFFASLEGGGPSSWPV